MNGNKNKRQRSFNGLMIAALASAGLGIGCTPVPGEVGPGIPIGPVDCNDLKAGALMIYEIPFPQEDSDVVHASTTFKVRWFAEYERGSNMNFFGFTGDYIASVTILENGMEVFYEEIDATPINVASGEYDEVILPAGLPAGTYLVRVVLDINGEVDQCNDLGFVLNNVREAELTIVPEPIDDEAAGTSGQGSNAGPRGTPAGR
ncbi:MAG: hypothetical protein H6819_10125 [Phycisphaerales bacterium]|nr:hypothetical protein [Phycisphaerales bacterium]MCB9856571.1 hypothetical protein [Phycisphaerales bacterium]MCB9864632.1 hypothetical protein [Phycisphaerales bacterium]